LAASYKYLYTRSTEVCNLLEKQKKTISELQAERSEHLAKISGLNDELIQLNSQLEHLKKQVKMMTIGTNVLEEI
jgi:peptidoglycan hydrolase CwlO-like protein